MPNRAKLKTHTKTRVYFWGIDLISARNKLGLTQDEFASLCGWTQQNQQQLELPGIRHRLKFDRRQAFHKAGVDV